MRSLQDEIHEDPDIELADALDVPVVPEDGKQEYNVG